MKSVAECRKLIGKNEKNYKETEIRVIRDTLYKFAEIIVGDFVKSLKKC